MLKEDIFESDDRKLEPIEVPEWKCGRVFIRTLTGVELDAYDMAIFKNTEDGIGANMRAELLVRAIADESGKRIFDDDDAASLGGKSAPVLDRLFDKAREINGMGREGREAALKNSGGVPSDANGSN